MPLRAKTQPGIVWRLQGAEMETGNDVTRRRLLRNTALGTAALAAGIDNVFGQRVSGSPNVVFITADNWVTPIYRATGDPISAPRISIASHCAACDFCRHMQTPQSVQQRAPR
jgi:hypothetical protein